MAEDKQVRKLREKLEKCLEVNRNDEADKLLEQLVALEPKNVRWPHKRGDLLRKLNRPKDAVICYETAVDLYAAQGFIARAVAMAKTVLSLDPGRIDVLQRVDPNAAQQLLRREPAGAPAPKKHPMILDDAAPAAPSVSASAAAPAAKKHPMILDDDAPLVSAATASAPSPPVMPSAKPAPKPSVPSAAAAVAMPPARSAPAAAPAAPSVGARVPGQAAPPPLPRAEAKPGLAAPHAPPPLPPPLPRVGGTPPAIPVKGDRSRLRKRPITLDTLSLPAPALPGNELPPAAAPAASKAPDVAAIYGQALGSVAELKADPNAGPNETRFADADDSGIEVDISEVELEPREPMPQLASMRPEPPSAEKLSKLPLFPLFAEFSKEALAEMIAAAELIELSHGELVIRKGDPGDALFGIVSGSVEVVLPGVPKNPGDKSRLTLAEGDVFGESCLLQDEKRHADVVAVGDLVALRLPRELLTSLVGRYPRLAEVLLELLTRRLLGNLLNTSPLFQEFDASGRCELARLFQVRRAPAGTVLAAIGKKMDGLYISLTGTLNVQQPGRPEQVAPPGSMFGQSTLLSNAPSQVAVSTRVNMIVLRLPQSAFTLVAMQYPTILAHLSALSEDVAQVTT